MRTWRSEWERRGRWWPALGRRALAPGRPRTLRRDVPGHGRRAGHLGRPARARFRPGAGSLRCRARSGCGTARDGSWSLRRVLASGDRIGRLFPPPLLLLVICSLGGVLFPGGRGVRGEMKDGALSSLFPSPSRIFLRRLFPSVVFEACCKGGGGVGGAPGKATRATVLDVFLLKSLYPGNLTVILHSPPFFLGSLLPLGQRKEGCFCPALGVTPPPTNW